MTATCTRPTRPSQTPETGSFSILQAVLGYFSSPRHQARPFCPRDRSSLASRSVVSCSPPPARWLISKPPPAQHLAVRRPWSGVPGESTSLVWPLSLQSTTPRQGEPLGRFRHVSPDPPRALQLAGLGVSPKKAWSETLGDSPFAPLGLTEDSPNNRGTSGSSDRASKEETENSSRSSLN